MQPTSRKITGALRGGHPSRRGLLKGMAGLGAGAALAATGPAVRPTTARAQDDRDSVVVGMHQELEFLNVLYTQGGNSLSASKLAQRGLLFLDADSNWIGFERIHKIDGIWN